MAENGRHAPRHYLEVKLPCGTCVHQGVCLIEEQLEQDLQLRIGVADARSGLVQGGPSQPLEVRIDCSWYDDRPIKPKGSGSFRKAGPWPRRRGMTDEQLAAARERMERVRPWERRRPKPPAEDAA